MISKIRRFWRRRVSRRWVAGLSVTYIDKGQIGPSPIGLMDVLYVKDKIIVGSPALFTGSMIDLVKIAHYHIYEKGMCADEYERRLKKFLYEV